MTKELPIECDDAVVRQYRGLLDVSESIISHRDLSELFHDLAERLHRVVDFDYISVVLHDAERNVMRLHILETPLDTLVQPGMETPVDQSPAGWVWEKQDPLLIHDISEEERFPIVTAQMREHGINTIALFPLTSAGRRLGALGFGSTREQAYTGPRLEFLEQVTKQVAVAVDNALNFKSAEITREQLARERDRLRLLLEINNAVVSNLELREIFASVSSRLREVIHHDYASLTLYDAESNQLRMHALDFSKGQGLIQEGTPVTVEGTVSGLAFTSRRPVLIKRLEFDQFPSQLTRAAMAEGLKSGCSVPLISHDRSLGLLNVGSLRENAFTEQNLEWLSQLGNQIAIAVENALAFQQIEGLKNKLTSEKLYLEEEIQTEYNFEEIIGHSSTLKRVLKQVETVAPTDSVVLIQGETGTGKEIIARAIHNLSARRERTLVKLNCAAIPTGLLESELFGHERGAFTGAIAQRIGRFEIAHRGTLFLDEVGDIPLELQPKLLRVLQEQEFERLGSTRTIRVDARLIAATNLDLAQMVAEKKFRSDLYYRLNVFPVSLPPLRERREDIPLLVRYFAQKYSRRMNKRIETIPGEAMDALVAYHWPGNVRELENLIERAVILTSGSYLQVPFAELQAQAADVAARASARLKTLEETERDYIEEVLAHTSGAIAGRGGAAEILGLPPSTLRSRMKKLGLK